MSVAGMLLADARFPAGGHAYSGGVEPAVTAGTVTGLASLEAFLRGRLRTAGLTAAGLAAAACAAACAAAGGAGEGSAASMTARGPGNAVPGEPARYVLDEPWRALDAEADARTPSPAQREASRRQGRALLRAARAAWPDDRPLAGLAAVTAGASGTSGASVTGGASVTTEYRGGPHHAVVLGVAAAAAGCAPGEAARIAAYQAVAGPASAAVRLLALDPMRAAAVLARLTADIDEAAGRAAAHSGGPPGDLPCPSAPALDLLAEAHIRAEVRLFES